MNTTYVKGLPRSISLHDLETEIERFALKIFGQFSWLKSGDTVLIKAAVNSPDPYPATTHPLAVKVLARLIRSHGGIPMVGDQSGLEYVVQNQKGVVKGSTHECFRESGIVTSEAEFIAFEEDPWDSFHHFTHPKAANWPNGMYVAKWVNDVDHIVALPRISAHGQGGVTLGAKNWVGILRQDSRLQFHAQGPLDFYIKFKTFNSGLAPARRIPGLDFFEMIAEIQLAVHAKLRGTFFVATEMQTTMGPNKYLIEELGIPMFTSYRYVPPIGLLIGSTDPVAADAVALAFLFEGYRHTPKRHKFWQRILIKANQSIRELGTYSVWCNPFIAHGLNLGFGTYFDDPHMLVIDDAPGLDRRLIDYLSKTE